MSGCMILRTKSLERALATDRRIDCSYLLQCLVFRLEIVDTRLPLIHRATLAIVLPEGFQIRRLLVRVIAGSHDFADGCCSFCCMIAWYVRDVVMDDVVLDGSVEEVASDEAEVAIDGGRCALKERPGLR